MKLIHSFILELARYEELLHDVTSTEADVAAALFGETPRAIAHIAQVDGRDAGFALWFYNFSTFTGKAGIYVEDLFVLPDFRGKGVGQALLRFLARRAVEEGLPRMEWVVLNWNEPAIKFYDKLGSKGMDEWTTRRLQGEHLKRLAGN